MAPSPVCNIEPKGPDKSVEICTKSVCSRNEQNSSKDNSTTTNNKSTIGSINIYEIEEAGLKSLLDEAYSYKSPKDRVGKSPLFQELLNEVEEIDAGKKKLIDRGCCFVDGLKATSIIENSHDKGSDKNFLNSILGGCERDKKKKKNGKRDGSSSNGGGSNYRRTKFTHSLKINQGPQASVYNDSISSTNSSFHGNSRSLSRTQQSLSTRLISSKAALLTSSSNIDVPMVTTYNKQPIMTPAVVSAKPQKNELLLFDLQNRKKESGNSQGSPTKNEEIELKLLDDVHGCNYTTHASLEIDGNDFDVNARQSDSDEKCNVLSDTSTCSVESSAISMNGGEEKSLQHSIAYKSLNGIVYCKENIVKSTINEIEENESQSEKTDKNNETCSADFVIASGTSSADESATRNNLLQKNVQSVSSIQNPTLKMHTETGYPITWPISGLLLLSGDTASYRTKESLEKKSGDESGSYSKDGSSARDRLDERKSKGRKLKKPDKNIILSESIEGHCGDKSISYLLEYIENNHSVGARATSHCVIAGYSPKNRTKSVSGIATKPEKPPKGKACTDEDIRNRKPAKAKDRLKKSTSLEDLHHNVESKANKKQSSMDDEHYVCEDEKEMTLSSKPLLESKTLATSTPTAEVHLPTIDNETHAYFDSLIDADNDNYTETEFHLVTKKHRKRKRRSKSRGAAAEQRRATFVGKPSPSHGFLPHNYTDRNRESVGFKRSTRIIENRHRSRRKSVSSSVVPSDKISDSDSVHSLPVSSTTPKCKMKKKSTSSGCTPQASYADIAKSPQCQSSMTLNEDPIGSASATVANKYHHVKTCISPSITSTAALSTLNTVAPSTSCFCVSSSDATAADALDHCDNAELVLSTRNYGNHVKSYGGCDQLLLISSNNLSHNCSSNFDSPNCVTGVVEEVKNCSNDYDTSSNTNNSNDIVDDDIVNDNNNNTDSNDVNNGDGGSVTHVEVTLKCKSNRTNKNNIMNNINNNDSHAYVNSKLEKSTSKEELFYSSCDTHVNSSSSKSKPNKSRHKKKTNGVDEADLADPDNGNKSSINKDDLFVEFTLKCAPIVKTKSSETQTDLVEVNNNSCCNEVSVEETVVLNNNRPNVVAYADVEIPAKDKLSTSLLANGTGGRVVVLTRENGAPSEVNIGFDVNEKLLKKTAVTESRTDVKFRERGSKYNIGEVIQYVNKSWNEVMESLSSAKISNTKTKVQYYIAK